MINFLTLKPEAFGLDIYDLSLKIAKLKKRGKFLSLVSFGEFKIPEGVVKDGEIIDENGLAKIIKEAVGKVKGHKLNTRNVIISLPEKKAFLQVIQMPKMAEEELKSAVFFEAENYIPLPIEDVYLDFQAISPLLNHLDHLDVLIAASPKNIVNSYVSCLKKAGLLPLALEIESQSVARTIVKRDISPMPLFIVDFGRKGTNFIIFSGTSIRFTTSISISSNQLTDIISKALNLDFSQAENLKIKYGLEMQEKIQLKSKKGDSKFSKEILKDKKIFEALIPILTDLSEQIKKHIDYYHSHAKHEHLPPNGKRVEKVILCGAGANLKGMADFLSYSLKMPVELGNPWTNILPEPMQELPELSFSESLGYATALGLALRGIRGEE